MRKIPSFEDLRIQMNKHSFKIQMFDLFSEWKIHYFSHNHVQKYHMIFQLINSWSNVWQICFQLSFLRLYSSIPRVWQFSAIAAM